MVQPVGAPAFHKAMAHDQPVSLNDLCTRTLNGDADAENAIFERLSVSFRALARRYVGAEAGDDVAQEACATVLAKFRTEKYEKSFAAWCHGVIRMTVRRYIHRQHQQSERETELVFEPAAADTRPADAGLREALETCLQDILAHSQTYARVLNLSFHGFKTQEVCVRLNITSNHYYVSLNRGREMLKKCLDKRGYVA